MNKKELRIKYKALRQQFSENELDLLDKENQDYIRKLTVIWGVKESIFKIRNEAGISFKDHIFESDFNLNDKQCKVTLRFNNKEEYFDILFDFIEDYVFVCAFNSVSLSDV